MCHGYGMSLLCNHWQFLLGIFAMATPNQTNRTNQKTQKQKNKMTRPSSLPLLSPWGVQSCSFWFSCSFLVSCFLDFWFLVFWFVVGGLKGWQNNTKVKDLGLTLCQFSHSRDRSNKPKTKKTKNKTQLSATTSPLGCAILFFLVFLFFFLVSCLLDFWFLVFWFVVGGLKGWQNNTKVKDLGLTLCQFSHFRSCKRAFRWFYCLRWACGSIWKPFKKQWKNAGITGGSLGGFGHRLGNFVCSCKFSKSVFSKCKNIGSQWMCRTDFDIDIVGSNP